MVVSEEHLAMGRALRTHFDFHLSDTKKLVCEQRTGAPVGTSKWGRIDSHRQR